MSGKYDDIISLPHFVSKNRKHMSNYDRAAQFAPFAALTGHAEAIRETARLTEEEIQLSDEELEELNRKFLLIRSHISEHPRITITHFLYDPYKEGGSYEETSVEVRRIDLQSRILQTTDRRKFDLDLIIDVKTDLKEEEKLQETGV